MPATQDLQRVRAVLETDREWSVFALADLLPDHRAFCEWRVAGDGSALTLVYRGFNPPLFFALGPPGSLRPLIEETVDEPHLYVSVRHDQTETLAAAGYRLIDPALMYRMVLRPEAFRQSVDPRAERLSPADCQQLLDLFSDGDATGERPAFFKDSSLASGVYFGVRENGVLLAVAGTHMLAPEEGVGCVGNVYTRRDQRGRGLASIATAAVTAELLRQGIRTIALNVDGGKAQAKRIYERLGFASYCEYWEGKASVVTSAELSR